MQVDTLRGRYTAEQKRQLLNNLDLEVTHRAHLLEQWVHDALAQFREHHEGLISRVPKAVRNMTLREFANYDANYHKASQGIRQVALGGQAQAIDKTTRKRKWIESQEQEAELAGLKSVATSIDEGMKPMKNARMTSATPKKPPVMNGTRGRLPTTLKTPSQFRSTQRLPSFTTPSPRKPSIPKPLPSAFPSSRPISPSKSKLPHASPTKTRPGTNTQTRPPSTSQFNPAIPAASSSTYPRWPRKDERMMSVNGSPLANPLNLDLTGWLSHHRRDLDEEPESLQGKGVGGIGLGHKRTASIIVRSASSSSQPGGPTHSRTNSQSGAASVNGKPVANGFVPVRNHTSAAQTADASLDKPGTPPPFPLAALVAVPTADGHLLEFDPFHTTPSEIDALNSISHSAKKKAKDDMRTLVMQAVERWKID